jgi:RES domain-containing protein
VAVAPDGGWRCFRFADHGSPLRVVPARRPLRFSRGDDAEPTQYLALHPLGPLAELARANDLRRDDQLALVYARLWALRVQPGDVIEVSFDTAATFDIDPPDLVSDDYQACQALAARLRHQVRGMVVPSAALPGTRNLVLFGARVAVAYDARIIDPAVDAAASMTSARGRAPFALRDAVCYRGDFHRGLAAFEERGDAFALDDEALWAWPEQE